MSLSESQLRYLRRIAEQMTEGATGEIVLVLHQGGVRDYRESRSLKPTDLRESDAGLARALNGR